MHVPVLFLIIAAVIGVLTYIVVLPVEWRRIKKQYADEAHAKRHPGQLSNDF